MKIDQLISHLEKKIKNPKKGLDEKIFLFLTRISPIVNIDLLVKDPNTNKTLLAWRKKGEKYPSGWHIPGGIIRFKESFDKRIKFVAKDELGSNIFYNKKPIKISEILLKQTNRSHFVSLLFSCYLKNKLSSEKMKKYKLKWFGKCPSNIIKPHFIYKNIINTHKINKNEFK